MIETLLFQNIDNATTVVMVKGKTNGPTPSNNSNTKVKVKDKDSKKKDIELEVITPFLDPVDPSRQEKSCKSGKQNSCRSALNHQNLLTNHSSGTEAIFISCVILSLGYILGIIFFKVLIFVGQLLVFYCRHFRFIEIYTNWLINTSLFYFWN